MGLEVETGKTAQAELQIVPGTLVEGSVLAATGEPVGDARLTIRSAQFPKDAMALREINCDSNGRYSVRLPAGRFELRFRFAGKGLTPAPDYEPKAITVVERLAKMAGPSFPVIPTPPPLVGPIDNSGNYRSDSLEFEPGIKWQPATSKLENAVRITGCVLDPDGNAVGGATVAPADTGTGNSLTGDTQYSVQSKADGSFVLLLPASGRKKYNLVVHDGKYEEWRTAGPTVSCLRSKLLPVRKSRM